MKSIIMLVLFSSLIFAQKVKISDLNELENGLFQATIGLDKSMAQIMAHFGTLKSRDSAIVDIENWTKNYIPLKKEKYDNAQYSIIKKYPEEIRKIFYYSEFYGASNEKAYFAYDKIPVSLGLRKNQVLLIAHSLVVTDIYNTLKGNNKERALKILTNTVYPSLNKMAFWLQNTDIKYFGLSVIYYPKDFSIEEDYKNKKAEALVLIAPVNKIVDFFAGKITDQDFLNLSEIYLFDRDSNAGLKIKF
jgi:hypothetical protein